ncbi:MAG: sulfatase-like hydrolase/transferase, partial [Planctomycetota bacterium]
MDNSKLLFFILGITLALLLGIPGCGKEGGTTIDPGPKPKRYNVLLISLDTLRADHLGAYGYERNVSPGIDLFARKAVRFDHAYSHAPWTTPSHAAMLTSLYPSVLGLNIYPDTGVIADRVETMAEYFKAQGYLTQAVTEGG